MLMPSPYTSFLFLSEHITTHTNAIAVIKFVTSAADLSNTLIIAKLTITSANIEIEKYL